MAQIKDLLHSPYISQLVPLPQVMEGERIEFYLVPDLLVLLTKCCSLSCMSKAKMHAVFFSPYIHPSVGQYGEIFHSIYKEIKWQTTPFNFVVLLKCSCFVGDFVICDNAESMVCRSN